MIHGAKRLPIQTRKTLPTSTIKGNNQKADNPELLSVTCDILA